MPLIRRRALELHQHDAIAVYLLALRPAGLMDGIGIRAMGLLMDAIWLMRRPRESGLERHREYLVRTYRQQLHRS